MAELGEGSVSKDNSHERVRENQSVPIPGSRREKRAIDRVMRDWRKELDRPNLHQRTGR